MPTRNVNLTEHFDRFIEEQVALGRFEDASDVMRAGLRLLEDRTSQQQQKLATLRALAQQGFEEIDQGQGLEFDEPQQLFDYLAATGRRIAATSADADNDQ